MPRHIIIPTTDQNTMITSSSLGRRLAYAVRTDFHRQFNLRVRSQLLFATTTKEPDRPDLDIPAEDADDLFAAEIEKERQNHPIESDPPNKASFSPPLIAAIREALLSYKDPNEHKNVDAKANSQQSPSTTDQLKDRPPTPPDSRSSLGDDLFIPEQPIDAFSWNEKRSDMHSMFDEAMDDFLFSDLSTQNRPGNSKSKPKFSVATATSPNDLRTMPTPSDAFSQPPKRPSPDDSDSVGFEGNSSRSSEWRDSSDGSIVAAVAAERTKNSVNPGFVNSFSNKTSSSTMSRSSMESFFGPDVKRGHNLNPLGVDQDQSESGTKHVPNRMSRLASNGFRINTYRNITGSVKKLLLSIHGSMFERVKEAIMENSSSPSLAFFQEMLEILRLARMRHKRDIRPQMNSFSTSLMDILPKLTPNEIGFVCIICGEIGYFNSLLFFHLFSELQKPGVLSKMSSDALFGTVLSFGMLQSIEGDFLDAVRMEFSHRLQRRETEVFPPTSIAALLLGCCHAKEHTKAKSLVMTTLDLIDAEKLFDDAKFVSWSDLAIALYTSGMTKVVNPGLLEGLHSRLQKSVGNCDATCVELSVMLLGLELLSPKTSLSHLKSIWDKDYAMLEDCVGELIGRNQIHVASVPDLIRSLSFPGMERVEYFKPLGQLIVESDEFRVPLATWVLVHRLLSGYANVRYRDPEVLRAVNKRLLAAPLAKISAPTIAQLLVFGCRLRALEEEVVNRVVELTVPNAFFWKKVYRAKDAAMLAYSLAGFDKLTPEVFGECWKRCSSVRFASYPRLPAQEAIDTRYIAQGLFTAYEYIRHKYSPSKAREHISWQGQKDLYGLIQQRNLTEAGTETVEQQAVAAVLKEMGVSLSCPALILDRLYRVDLCLHDVKAVVFVSGRRSYFCNPPHEFTGYVFVLKKAIESRNIKVIMIKSCDWNSTPEQHKETFLRNKFAEEGINLDKLCSKNTIRTKRKETNAEEVVNNVMKWLTVRSLVLQMKPKEELKTLYKERKRMLGLEMDDKINDLARVALQQINIQIPDAQERKRSFTNFRKIDLIWEILCVEVNQLFGESLKRPLFE